MLDKWRLGIRDKRGCLEVLLTKLILMLLKLSILFGAVLILLCGAAQSGVSMLCTVVQGVSTVLLSQEILSDIRKAMMPDSKVRSLFEKDKKLGVIPCYQDNEITLKYLIQNTLKLHINS